MKKIKTAYIMDVSRIVDFDGPQDLINEGIYFIQKVADSYPAYDYMEPYVPPYLNLFYIDKKAKPFTFNLLSKSKNKKGDFIEIKTRYFVIKDEKGELFALPFYLFVKLRKVAYGRFVEISGLVYISRSHDGRKNSPGRYSVITKSPFRSLTMLDFIRAKSVSVWKV